MQPRMSVPTVGDVAAARARFSAGGFDVAGVEQRLPPVAARPVAAVRRLERAGSAFPYCLRAGPCMGLPLHHRSGHGQAARCRCAAGQSMSGCA